MNSHPSPLPQVGEGVKQKVAPSIAIGILVIISCFLSACIMHHPPMVSPQIRAKQAADLAKVVGWKEHTIQTDPFILKAYGPRAEGNNSILNIYIEGDGLAWFSEDTPSDNPTPMEATALKMAIHNQKNDSVVYLARPCQFVFDKEWKACRQAYWANLRFSPEVISAMNQAVDHLKKYYHAKQIILIGYSGGGTIAALIAARRTDVKKLITVAAVLDVKQWVEQKSLTPLNGSLDPADVWKNLVFTPQIHWVGGKDRVVPKEVAFAFVNQFPKGKKPQIIIVPTFDHVCCWAREWQV